MCCWKWDPKHMVPAPPKSPEEVEKLLEACKLLPPGSGITELRDTSTCQVMNATFLELGGCPKQSTNAAPMDVDPDPSEASWDALEWETAAYKSGKQQPLSCYYPLYQSIQQ